MKPRSTIARLGSILLVSLLACVDPYTPPEVKTESQRIVIDGFLDSDQQMITVKISQAVSLTDSVSSVPVSDAVVSLEDDSGNSYSVGLDSAGLYRRTSISVIPSRQYRITVAEGTENYQSDFVPVSQAPPIDSLTYNYDADNLYVYLFTHASQEDQKYFRWDFVETWAYRARFNSRWEVVDHQIVPRPDDIYHCYYVRPSSYIDLETTDKLTSNVISYHVVTAIPYNSIKLSNKYSILVRQFTVSKAEFQFWQELGRTTEDLGSLFDAQPSTVTGNVHTTSGDPTIGYFSAGSAQVKRLTIDTNDIPFVKRPETYDNCNTFDFDTIPPPQAPLLPSVERILYPVYQGIALIGYSYAYQTCADCTLYGGTNVKPDYW